MRGSYWRTEGGWTTFTANQLPELDTVERDVPHIRMGLRRNGASERFQQGAAQILPF
jgi:hypothetical protein